MTERTAEDEERDVDRLHRFLTRPGPGFGLALALYRDPVVAREIRAEIERRVGGDAKINTVTLTREDGRKDLVARMIEGAQGARALFIVGLDRLLVDSAGKALSEPSIANLNQRRDRLPELVDARVVFWVSKASYANFREQAWDLHEVMLTIAEFDRRAGTVVHPARATELPQWFSFVGEDEVPAVEQHALTLARVAEQSDALTTRADAAASAAQAFVAVTRFDDAERWLERAAIDYEETANLVDASRQRGRLGELLELRGRLDDAQAQLQMALGLAERSGDERQRAFTMGQMADILKDRGDLDDALRIHREDELPVFERLGDVREKAITIGKIADILQARGDLDEALRIRREDELPVFERLGDVRSKAITMGQIADILQARGDLDEALRIRREDELPVYERLGDIRSKAITIGKIADILHARGDLDEALRIRREDQLPVYERLGDVREKAVTMGKIADILQARGDLDEALRIRREDQLPVYERLGDVRSKAVCQTNIALTRLQQADESAREDATRLLSTAHRAFTRMRLPEATTVEDIANRHRLRLDSDSPPIDP